MNMREKMPQTAAFIDGLRQAFGHESINEQIKRGLKGEATFYAIENGHELGTDWLSLKGEDHATS